MQNTKGIYSKRCWIEGRLQEATILYDASTITDIVPGPKFSDNLNTKNYNEKVIIPGAIDAHVHINEPGRTHWEGFQTATTAAVAGGITTLVDMPLNSSPVTTNAKAFDEKISAGNNKLLVNCGLYGGLVPDNISELQALIDCGVLGIKCFLTHSGIDDFPNVQKKDIEAAMSILTKNNIPLLAHCELIDTPNEIMRNPKSYQQYLNSRPKKWENDAVDLMIEMCAKYGVRTHIVHVSSAEALQSISDAKLKGLPLTAETCPHYLYFNSQEIPYGNTLYKCAPPIRERANNNLLKKALKNGILDFLTSDHSPAPPELKEIDSGNLQKAWGGISGLQYLLSASWTALKDEITLEKFIPLLTENPSKFLGIDDRKGFLKKGMDADFTIWSPQDSFIVSKEDNYHRHKVNPYLDKRLYGMINATYVDGVEVFDQKIINFKKFGQWILKK